MNNATDTEQTICFSNRIHEPHGTCAGLDADTLFERTMDARS